MTRNEILAEIKALQAKITDLVIELQWLPPGGGPNGWEYVPDPDKRRRVPQWDDSLFRLPLSTRLRLRTQFARLRDMGPGQPRGNFEVEV